MLDELRKELERISRRKRAAALSPARPISGAIVELRGKQVIDFTNWDLLNVGKNQKVKRAAQASIEHSGVGLSSPRLSSGTAFEHSSAEQRLAKFIGAEAVLIIPSKNQGIFTICAALLNERDTIVADELVQAPLTDAAFLVNASLVTCRIADDESLNLALEKSRLARRKMLYVEGLSAVTGVPADLATLVERCAKEDVQIVVDESYSLGVLGARGAGGVEGAKLLPPFCVIADLGQSMGLFGGFIAGPQILISYLIERSRALGLDAPLPPSFAAAVEAAIDFVELGHLAREELAKRAKFLGEALRIVQIPVLGPLASPIISIRCAKLSQAQELAVALLQRGFLVDAVAAQVPFSEVAYLRLLVSVRHTERQLSAVAQAIGELVPRVLRK